MFLEKIDGILPGQFVRVKYECDGGYEKCGKEWKIKLKDAIKNHAKHGGKLICRQCQMSSNNPMKRTEVKEKIKRTNLQRYGTECSMNTPGLIEERSKKYEDPDYVEEVTKKRRETFVKKYGVDHPMKTEDVQERQKNTLRERYGVDHPLQNEEILERAKQTNLERYGVEWGLSLPEIRSKGIETMMEKYGVTHYNQLPEMRDYLRENCREWLTESYAHPWSKGLPKTESQKAKQSATMASKIIAGEFNPEDSRFFLTGYFTSHKCKKQPAFFRSSLELLMHYLLHVDPDVLWYENEPFSIEYEKEPGVIRRYVPDFFVFKVNCRPIILEMKPAFRMREEIVQFKVEAAEKFAEENNFDFMYVDEKYIKNQQITLEDIVALSNVNITKKTN